MNGKSWLKGLSLVLAVALAWSGYALLWDADASVWVPGMRDSGKCPEASALPYAMIPLVPVALPWPLHDAWSNVHYNNSDTHSDITDTHMGNTDYHFIDSSSHDVGSRFW